MFMQGGDIDDVMSAFFGGGMQGGARRRRKGKDVGHALPVSLEDLYNGKDVTLPRSKTVLCSFCKGTGSTNPTANSVCQDCRGRGVRVIMRPVGPGMMQQMQAQCERCGGEGKIVQEKFRCKHCTNGTSTVEAPLTVHVEPGMEHQDQIPFAGEGDQHPEIEVPGDIVIVLQQLKHDVYTRDGADLKMKKKLSLGEALCGFQFVVEHLDGRKLVVRNEPGQLIKPGDVKVIAGEGMPIHKGNGYGDMVVEFEVEFPERMSDSEIELLRNALPPPSNTEPAAHGDDTDVCYLSRQPLDEIRREMEREADDDEEGGSGPGNVQCASQ